VFIPVRHASDDDLKQGRQALVKIHRIV